VGYQASADGLDASFPVDHGLVGAISASRAAIVVIPVAIRPAGTIGIAVLLVGHHWMIEEPARIKLAIHRFRKGRRAELRRLGVGRRSRDEARQQGAGSEHGFACRSKAVVDFH